MKNNQAANLIQAIKKAAAIQQQIVERISDSHQSIVLPISKMQRSLEKFNRQIFHSVNSVKILTGSLLPGLQAMADFSKGLQEFRIEEKEALIKSGWFICPSLDPVPYPWIRRAVIQYKSDDKGSLTRLMKNIYGRNDWEYLGKIVKGWSTHRLFSKHRMKIIWDALGAHKEGKYTLSIPALLPITEGVSGDFCSEQKMKVNKSKSMIKAKKALAQIDNSGDSYLSEITLYFIENQLYVHSDQLKASRNKKYLNRHSILHGSQTGYADCARSLRCFLLLDVLTLL